MDFLSMYEMSPYTLFSAMVSITIAFFISKSFVKYHYYLQNKINNIEYAVHELKLLQVEQLRMLCDDSQDSQDSQDEEDVDEAGEDSQDEEDVDEAGKDSQDEEDETINSLDTDEEDDEEEEKTTNSKGKTNVDVDDVIEFIKSTSPEYLEMILQACSDTDKILIPNWFTKVDFEDLTDVTFTNSQWLKLTEKSEELIGHTNAMVVQWFDNIGEFSDNEDDDSEENNEVFDSDDVHSHKMLIETDSDEESINETKESVENQLYQLKVEQLKKMASVNKNSKNMTKSELISSIMKKNSIKNVKKSLSKFV